MNYNSDDKTNKIELLIIYKSNKTNQNKTNQNKSKQI